MTSPRLLTLSSPYRRKSFVISGLAYIARANRRSTDYVRLLSAVSFRQISSNLDFVLDALGLVPLHEPMVSYQ